jgi:hypothetical protein
MPKAEVRKIEATSPMFEEIMYLQQPRKTVKNAHEGKKYMLVLLTDENY